MALMNRRIAEEIETIFLMPHEAYSYLSSRLVKEVALLGGMVKGLVSPLTERMLGEKYHQHEPGKCPKCGMTLVAKKQDPRGGS